MPRLDWDDSSFWTEVVQPTDAWWRVPAAWRADPTPGPAPDEDPRPTVAALWKAHAGLDRPPPAFDARWRAWLGSLEPTWQTWVLHDVDPVHVFLGPGWDWGWPFTWHDNVIVWPGSDAFWTRTPDDAFHLFRHEMCHLWQRSQGTREEWVGRYEPWARAWGFAPGPDENPVPARIRNPDALDLWSWREPQAVTGWVTYGYQWEPSQQRPVLVDLHTGVPAPRTPGYATRVRRTGTHQLDHPHEFVLPQLDRAFGHFFYRSTHNA